MNPDQLRAGLISQERFSPDVDVVLQRGRLATESAHRRARRHVMLRRTVSVAIVGVLTVTIAVVHGRSVGRPAMPSVSMVAGTHWQLTSASVAGMPSYDVQPDLTESLYLYPGGTSVTTGFCFTRQGKWQQHGDQLLFTDQRTLQHSCALGVLDTAPQRALKQLDGPMTFTIANGTLHLHNTGTTMTLKAAGAASGDPRPQISPSTKVLTDITWQLTSAIESGKHVALPKGRITTVELYSDGTSTMVGYGCFYQTGRWHTVEGGLELTDQDRPVMSCYAIPNDEEVAGSAVLARLSGTMEATVAGTTLTLSSGDTVDTFTDSFPATADASSTATSVTTAGRSRVATRTAPSSSSVGTATPSSGGVASPPFGCGRQLPAPLPGVTATPILQPGGWWQFRLTNATKLALTVDTLHGYAQVTTDSHGLVESISEDDSDVLRRPITLVAGASNVFDPVAANAYACSGARITSGEHLSHLVMNGVLNGRNVVFTAATFMLNFAPTGQPAFVK